jgi:hypothetical protein
MLYKVPVHYIHDPKSSETEIPQESMAFIHTKNVDIGSLTGIKATFDMDSQH